MKDVLTKLEYSVDYDPTDATPEDSATWTTIPIGKVFADNAQLFQEEAQYADLINGSRRVAAATGSATYPVEWTPGDTNLDALETALNGGEAGVWIRETVSPGHTLICGGTAGCFGGVTVSRSGYGGFAMKVIDLTSPAAETGEAYVATAAS